MHPAKGLMCQSCFEHTLFFLLLLTDKKSAGQDPNVAVLDCQHPSLVPRHPSWNHLSLHHFGNLTTGRLHLRKVVDRYRVARDGCTLNRDIPRYKPSLCLRNCHKHAYACRLADLWESQCHFRAVSCTISSAVVTRHLIAD